VENLAMTDLNPFIFVVNEEPYALWDPDLRTRSLQFLDSIDPEFFAFLAESHAEKLESIEHRRRVAPAVRMAYLHGIETLMTLLGATAQAPQAPYAWVALARTEWLRTVVDRITKGDPTLHTELIKWDRTWGGLAARVFSFLPQGSGWGATAKAFGRVWTILAYQFLDGTNQLEYNSLKHGFRARSTGAKISLGKQPAPGVPAPEEDMVLLGGSETGSTFFAIESAGPAAASNRSRRSRRRTVNWEVEPMLRGLQLIDVSIRNLVSFMRIVHGVHPDELQFWRLEGVDDYEMLLRDTVGVRSISLDYTLPDAEIAMTNRKELLDHLAKAFGTPDKNK
jgi:hypothetical protein